MNKDKRSFLERLTGGISIDDEEDAFGEEEHHHAGAVDEPTPVARHSGEEWMEEENEEAQLTVDVYQTPSEIVLKTMVAGVKPDDLNVSITRDMVTIKGKRSEESEALGDDYFVRELYWGSFARTILLPEEVMPEEAQAVEKHGLLTIRMPKIDKEKTKKIKIKSG